eukprot:GGOE01036931.1.p1 GENE.GGOE01036931.1~~GGOE01036931.1.p1  ORF type:complete len:533 (+),score=164.61 GGOE01036931.1:40-1599(+)
MSAVAAALGRCLVMGCSCGRYVQVNQLGACQCGHLERGHIPCWASQAQLQAPPCSLTLCSIHRHCGLPFEAHPTGDPSTRGEHLMAAQLAALRQATEAVQQVTSAMQQLLDVTLLHQQQQHALLVRALGKDRPPSEESLGCEEPSSEASRCQPVDVETINFEQLLADGKLDVCSLQELKEYCRLQRLKVKGSKTELLRRIRSHLEHPPMRWKRGRDGAAKVDGGEGDDPARPSPPPQSAEMKGEGDSSPPGEDVLQVQQPDAPLALQKGQANAESVSLRVDVHVPARDLADMSSLPEATVSFMLLAVKEGCPHYIEDTTTSPTTIPDTEEGRLQHLYGLYGKFFKQVDLMKKIVFGLSDQNRRTDFRHSYAITLWTASGLVSAATVRLLQSTRHPSGLEVVCAMTRADQERRGFGTLLLRQVVVEAQRLNCEAVYIKAEQSTSSFWRKRGCVPCTFPSHIEHACLQSTGTVSLKLQVAPEAAVIGPHPDTPPYSPRTLNVGAVTMRRSSPALQLHMSTG